MDVEDNEQHSPLLGRNKVHDPRSRGFAMPTKAIDRSTWKDKVIRVYDPLPNPNQSVGCCTGVAKCSQFNSIGNRRTGVVLGMPEAEACYSRNSQIDPFQGSWPPEDTGSSGLASCKTAQEFEWGGAYYHLFGGADEVVQNLMAGKTISVGTYWYESMFYPTASGLVTVSGDIAGGHQYLIRGYDVDRDRVMGRCWWGAFRDFWMSRTDLNRLLREGGDAHWQERRQA
jgi:hypothetical protein